MMMSSASGSTLPSCPGRVEFTDENALLSLGRELERNAAAMLRHLAPPFSMIWGHKETGEVFFQNDGLGQSQLFEYDDGRVWALTNRISAFAALGLPLEPDLEMWMARWALKWFPMNGTGFKRVTSAAPGSRFRVSGKRVTWTEHDVPWRYS